MLQGRPVAVPCRVPLLILFVVGQITTVVELSSAVKMEAAVIQTKHVAATVDVPLQVLCVAGQSTIVLPTSNAVMMEVAVTKASNAATATAVVVAWTNSIGKRSKCNERDLMA